MKCIIIAASTARTEIAKRIPTSLFPIIDRPSVQHAVEAVVRNGITDIEFVTCQDNAPIEELFGQGERWGAQFTYHKCNDAARPYDVVKQLEIAEQDEPFLLVHADRLPYASLDCLFKGEQTNMSIWHRAGETETWSGWAKVTGEFIQALPHGSTEDEFADYMRSLTTDKQRTVTDALLDVRTPDNLQTAQQTVLNSNWVLYGRELRPGIRICRNVRIDKTAEIDGPVFLGDNVWIGANVKLGPYAVIGDNCVVERSTHIKNSLVFPNTVIGEHLNMSDTIVAQNDLFNVRLNAELTVDDPLVVGEV